MTTSRPARCWARVKTAFEGYHRYPGAPDAVAFLRSLHRHIFGVTVWVEQFHGGRDVEYIQLLRWLREHLHGTPFGEQASCEEMALLIGQAIQQRFPGRGIKVEVAEDDENGALIELDADPQFEYPHAGGAAEQTRT